MTYNIRGTTSINGGEPLVLVNNVPMDINMIDPQDIESVSILKDAASAAIYGARAAFGVILITTKQGKKDMAPRFNYNNNFSFSKASELPQKASPLESVLAYKEMGWANDTYVDGKNITQWEGYIRDYQANPSNYPNGYIFDDQGNLFLMRENDMFADMMDNFGFMQNHSFSVSGGSQRTSYRLSLGYTGEDGILVTDKDKFDRINMSSFLSVDVNKWLTTQLDIRYANSTQNKVEQGGRNGVWGSAMHLPSYHNILPYEQDGIEYPAETSATFVRYGEPRVIKKTNLRTLGRVIISPLKGLKITGEYTYNRITEYNRMYVNKYKYIGFNFTGLLNNVENSRYALTQGFTNYNAINAFANYAFSIGKHDISIMGGYNQEESHKESQWSQRTDVLLENLPSLSGSTGTASVTDSFDEYAIRGLFYRVNYTYDGKYMFEANGRYDGTSRFPKDSRFGFFPSVALGWIPTNYEFIRDRLPWLDYFKIRGSWGQVGNDQITNKRFPYLTLMNENASAGWNGSKGVTESSIGADNLQWEKATKLDLGIDAKLFGQRVNFTVDFFRDRRDDIFQQRTMVPDYVGLVEQPYGNVGSMVSFGADGNISYTQDFGRDFTLTLRGNFTYTANMVKTWEEAFQKYAYQEKADKPYNFYSGYIALGLFRDEDDVKYSPDQSSIAGRKVLPGDIKYKDVNGDGVITSDDQVPLSSNPNYPRLMYGFGAEFRWKKLTLGLLFKGVGNVENYVVDYWKSGSGFLPFGTGTTGNVLAITANQGNRWTPREISGTPATENPNAMFPRLSYGNDHNSVQNSTFWKTNARYLRLQEINLSYNFTSGKILKAVGVSSLDLQFVASNVCVWSPFKHWDPELAAYNGTAYPIPARYAFQMYINF